MKLIKQILIMYLISFSFLNLSNVVFSESQSIYAEGEYRLGDRDTREKAKKAALADAKRKLTEQAGIYIESYTEVKNFKVSKDQIKSYANAMLKIKSERVEFLENGTICRAFVTAIIDVTKINEPKPKGGNKKSGSKSFYIDFKDLEASRTNIVYDLSKATSFTAASEYKLQEVTGITNIGHYDEKGSIANSLQENPEMKKNYRFAELDSFIDEAGASKIMDILNEKDQSKDKDAKERMTWAKKDRVRAKKYQVLVIKAATALSKKISKMISKTDGMEKDRLQVLKTEIDDAIKLAKALDMKNKAVDKVVQNYEKWNKIVVKDK